jgi:ABC-type bacteriocin/lantibiotic exporter with double-glycine peptidase domain
MVAGAHGLDTDLPTLRQRFSLSLKGVTLADMVRMAEAMRLNSRALRAELDELPQVELPCVLHWDLNHFVVLVALRGGVAVIHDPGRGLRRLRMEEFSRHFTGVVLELSPAPGFVVAQERRRFSVRQLLGPVSGLKRALAQIVMLALALKIFVLLSPFFMQWVVDGVMPGADRDLLVTLGVGFGLLVLIQVATAAARSWAVLVLSASPNRQWMVNVFAHLLRLPVAWFEKRHAGDIWSRFGAVQQIQRTLTTSFIEAVLDGLLVGLTLAMMAIYSATLTSLALGAVALYALQRWAFYRPLAAATEEALVFEARQSTHFLESLHGVQAIKRFQRRGRSAVAICQPGGRHDERPGRGPTPGADVIGRPASGVRPGARAGDRCRRVAGPGRATVGGHALRLLRLPGDLRHPGQRIDRQGGGTEDAAPAGRAAGRHRPHRARGRYRAPAAGDRGWHRAARRELRLRRRRTRGAAAHQPEDRPG